MKKCYTCCEFKPEIEFYKDSRTNDGLFYECKSCKLKRQKYYYSVPENREKRIKYKMEYRQRPEIKEKNKNLRYINNLRQSKYRKKNKDKLNVRAWMYKQGIKINETLMELKIRQIKLQRNIDILTESELEELSSINNEISKHLKNKKEYGGKA